MARGRDRFADEWSRALTCHFLHKSVGAQEDAFIPATRLSILRLLVAVDIAEADALLCGRGPGAVVRGLSGGGHAAPSMTSRHNTEAKSHPGNESRTALTRDTGVLLPPRLRTVLETFLAAKIHVTLVLTGHDTAVARAKHRGAPNPRCSCERVLRYLGVLVVPSLPQLEFRRKPTKRNCRFDAVYVAGVEPFKRLLIDLKERCPLAAVAFDVVGTGDGSEEFRRLRTSPFLNELGHIRLSEAAGRVGGVQALRASLSAAAEAEIQFMLHSAVVVLPTERDLTAARRIMAVQQGEGGTSSALVIPKPVPMRLPLAAATAASKAPPPFSFLK